MEIIVASSKPTRRRSRKAGKGGAEPPNPPMQPELPPLRAFRITRKGKPDAIVTCHMLLFPYPDLIVCKDFVIDADGDVLEFARQGFQDWVSFEEIAVPRATEQAQ